MAQMTAMKKRMAQLDFTCEKLGSVTNLTANYLSQIANERLKPSLRAAYRIAKALDCEIEDINLSAAE